jgi:hypothetical protein
VNFGEFLDREGIPEAAPLPKREGSRCVSEVLSWRDIRNSWLGMIWVWLWGLGGKKVATKDKRWYKDVGLGFKTPAEAINGTYIGTPTIIASQTSPQC